MDSEICQSSEKSKCSLDTQSRESARGLRGYRCDGPFCRKRRIRRLAGGDPRRHFQSCGSINRVTILLDKFTGHPQGVVPKRTNLPGMTRGRGRGRGIGRGGFGRGGFPPRGAYRGGYRGGGGRTNMAQYSTKTPSISPFAPGMETE
ncbi:predicted protein [Histoplasma mississippiense (nom. inval.)]|uniref:predicted protein n=1 Tax=Ajellomyces capsulatus (strain NAm1 / WU24) TaxID=2059318 RepID=UPI000157CD17|nr:predicted protein [Histoplasma mississippiense (nom. inval.)]EDN10357.1 predicted protein [Histoplasma mississippiense (nom. inval.)]